VGYPNPICSRYLGPPAHRKLSAPFPCPLESDRVWCRPHPVPLLISPRRRLHSRGGVRLPPKEIARNEFDEAAATARTARRQSAGKAAAPPSQRSARRGLRRGPPFRGSQQVCRVSEIETRAAAARRTVLPIRILQLCRAVHLHLNPDDAARIESASQSRAYGV
jgi:hypothetical protein